MVSMTKILSLLKTHFQVKPINNHKCGKHDGIAWFNDGIYSWWFSNSILAYTYLRRSSNKQGKDIQWYKDGLIAFEKFWINGTKFGREIWCGINGILWTNEFHA